MSSESSSPRPATAVTIGTFDGLHKGHRLVIATLKKLAHERSLRPMVMTFDRHPLETVAPHRAPGYVLPPSEKTGELWSHGLDLHVVEFTPETAALSAREWMEKLHAEFGVRALVVGYDNTFGCDGVNMSIDDYKKMGGELGIEVVEAPIEKGVSSSAIRRLVAAGEMEKACEMLGKPFHITGEVVHGKALGREIGFPTANLKVLYKAHLPMKGVYAADVEVPGGRVYDAVVNVGTRPTVSDSDALSIEAHLLGFSGDLYGKKITVRFRKLLREEMRFEDVMQLKRQIQKDIASLRRLKR